MGTGSDSDREGGDGGVMGDELALPMCAHAARREASCSAVTGLSQNSLAKKEKIVRASIISVMWIPRVDAQDSVGFALSSNSADRLRRARCLHGLASAAVDLHPAVE
eukprot:scaffold276763_cov30-Tisochrysis_lutea.AAC.1